MNFSYFANGFASTEKGFSELLLKSPIFRIVVAKTRLASKFGKWFGGEGGTNAQDNIFSRVVYVNPLLLWASKQTVGEIVDEIGKVEDWMSIFSD